MMNNGTKQHIDAARQVLVGKVPDPKAQVEQITNALIYKFMSDMDQQAVDVGGKASFFVEGYEQYAWQKIMSKRLSGQERMDLYIRGLESMAGNPHLPELFRAIMKGSFLPYRDAETLSLFLKEIDWFTYDNSENLGDAYEYLLSVMGSQGAAGQFRTPRHIIDFMVQVMQPQKDERILDPACGTAGFLISAFKFIESQHQEKALTPDEKQNLAGNLVGYDISPDMVRISQVNMYLHNFPNPGIYEYDTLTSEERWDDDFDLIMANPPFMSPKGGIRPHQRFAIQANRSEVLFVDYIMEHLTPHGRAAVIVPEGIIFQSNNAYKNLRRMLVEENYLYAVVSLPAGVFNPYSGVKTSILFIDRDFAKTCDSILFVEVQNDGFSLGSQRNPIEKNDLPNVIDLLKQNKNKILISESKLFHLFSVKKNRINSDVSYSLSRSIYQNKEHTTNFKYPSVSLNEILDLHFGTRITRKEHSGSNYPVYGGGGESFRTNTYNRENDFVISRFGISEKCVRFVKSKFFLLDSGFTFSIKNRKIVDIDKSYIGMILMSIQERIYSLARGNAQKNLDIAKFKEIKIPLPPLRKQKEIVEELDGYQKIIDGARMVVENWKPHIDIDPDWEMVELGEVCEFMTGGTPLSSEMEYYRNGAIKWLVSGDIHKGEIYDCKGRITEKGLENSNAKILPIDSVLIALNGQGKTRGTVAMLRTVASCNQSLVSINPIDKNNVLSEFIYYQLKQMYSYLRNITGDRQRSGLSINLLKRVKIHIPPISRQKSIIEILNSEKRMIMQNEELIKVFNAKLEQKVSQIWIEK